MIAAIVLAAGTSSRYGANKLLLPFGDGTVISTVVATLARSPSRPTVVVTGHESDQVRAALQAHAAAVTFVHNPDFRAGEMLSSIKTAVRSLLDTSATEGLAGVSGALITLGDQPLLRLDVLERLITAFEQQCGDIIAPRYGMDGPRGHPVLIGRNWWQAILALPPEGNVRDLLRANPQRVTHLVVNTDTILGDVDTPEAYQAALTRQANDGR